MGIYPGSKVELRGFVARHYDLILDVISFGGYLSMLKRAIGLMEIRPDDKILDLGAGTGRNASLMAGYLSRSEKAEILGLDISPEMIAQFEKRALKFKQLKVVNQRIDVELSYRDYFDKVFISFVLHGFPEKVREIIARNAFRALKPGGKFFLFDYAEFPLEKMPLPFRFIFKNFECRYAVDFIATDRKQMLAQIGFYDFKEHFFVRNFLRLLVARKPEE